MLAHDAGAQLERLAALTADYIAGELEQLVERSVPRVPERLDLVRFVVGDDELEVAFQLALELAKRAARAPDEAARTAAARIRSAGASRPIKLSSEEQAAVARVIDAWEAEAETVRRLRERFIRA